MLMMTTERTCQRTVGSRSSCHTDTVWKVSIERCSSCISSISAWILHLALYHFRATEHGEQWKSLLVIVCTTIQIKSAYMFICNIIWQIMTKQKWKWEMLNYIWNSHILARSLTCDGGMNVVLFNQQITRTFWKPWQQYQLDKCWYNHQGKKEGPVLLLSIKPMEEKHSFIILDTVGV